MDYENRISSYHSHRAQTYHRGYSCVVVVLIFMQRKRYWLQINIFISRKIIDRPAFVLLHKACVSKLISYKNVHANNFFWLHNCIVQLPSSFKELDASHCCPI